jgi:hypothetical protein
MRAMRARTCSNLVVLHGQWWACTPCLPHPMPRRCRSLEVLHSTLPLAVCLPLVHVVHWPTSLPPPACGGQTLATMPPRAGVLVSPPHLQQQLRVLRPRRRIQQLGHHLRESGTTVICTPWRDRAGDQAGSAYAPKQAASWQLGASTQGRTPHPSNCSCTVCCAARSAC